MPAVCGLAIVVAACGGGGDDKGDLQRSGGTASATTAAGAAAQGGPAGAGNYRFVGGAGGGFLGQVESVDSSTVAVANPAGKQSFRLRPDTQISRVVSASVADLSPGANIRVSGTPGADGTTQARLIELDPSDGAGAVAGDPTAVTGNIESVTTDTLRLRTATGTFVYRLTPDTRCTRLVPAAVADLIAGAFVAVSPIPDSGEPLEARSITIMDGAVARVPFTGAPGDGAQRIILTPPAGATPGR